MCYAVGWTHHTVGVQYIRAASIVQLLLGNIGRPGGGILALRGHASIQGSTDIPTLYELLPGYIPMPHANGHTTLKEFIESDSSKGGFWGHMRRLHRVSLLKAYYGDAATAQNEFAFQHLPRVLGIHSFYETIMGRSTERSRVISSSVKIRPSVRRTALHQRRRIANLEWLVVRDLSRSRRRRFGKTDPRIGEDGGLLLSGGRPHREKRLVHQHAASVAVASQSDRTAGGCRSELWFYYHLGKRIREKLARRAIDAIGRSSISRGTIRPAARSRSRAPRRCCARSTAGTPKARRSAYTELKADGSTGCGCWIYCGVTKRARTKPLAQAAQRAELGRARVGLGVAGQPAHALQSRFGRSRRQAVERAQEVRLVG